MLGNRRLFGQPYVPRRKRRSAAFPLKQPDRMTASPALHGDISGCRPVPGACDIALTGFCVAAMFRLHPVQAYFGDRLRWPPCP